VATVLVAAARTRRETRGCHWREDFPGAEDEWRGHLLHTLDRRARLTQSFEEMA
jgi:L-aspartate oxidase